MLDRIKGGTPQERSLVPHELRPRRFVVERTTMDGNPSRSVRPRLPFPMGVPVAGT